MKIMEVGLKQKAKWRKKNKLRENGNNGRETKIKGKWKKKSKMREN